MLRRKLLTNNSALLNKKRETIVSALSELRGKLIESGNIEGSKCINPSFISFDQIINGEFQGIEYHIRSTEGNIQTSVEKAKFKIAVILDSVKHLEEMLQICDGNPNPSECFDEVLVLATSRANTAIQSIREGALNASKEIAIVLDTNISYVTEIMISASERLEAERLNILHCVEKHT